METSENLARLRERFDEKKARENSIEEELTALRTQKARELRRKETSRHLPMIEEQIDALEKEKRHIPDSLKALDEQIKELETIEEADFAAIEEFEKKKREVLPRLTDDLIIKLEEAVQANEKIEEIEKEGAQISAQTGKRLNSTPRSCGSFHSLKNILNLAKRECDGGTRGNRYYWRDALI